MAAEQQVDASQVHATEMSGRLFCGFRYEVLQILTLVLPSHETMGREYLIDLGPTEL